MTTPTTTIRLHNSMTRRKEEFIPLDPKNVRVYLCGPTVYDRAHLGNARNVILFDILVRVLREVYGADHVTYARNFTDVDDKINTRAAESGRSIGEITDETIGWYHADMDALGNARPDLAPRATEFIAEMVTMIAKLEADGFAYAKEGHVLFRVRKYEDYGRLSGRSLDDMIAGARVEVAPFKEDPMDFVLWKPSAGDQPGWDSPWGHGRPGWHIECSAMTQALFGPSFDIHGGGNDLMFPHHENEIAQSCCANPDGGFAQVWMHNEMLLVEGKKMSKSLGNFFTVRDLLDQGVPGEVIRLVFLMTQYGKPMDWTEKKRDEAQGALEGWRAVLSTHGFNAELVAGLKAAGDWTQDAEFIGVLANDMNTPGALARLHVLAKGKTAAMLVPFAAGLEVLGLVSDWSALAEVGPSGVATQDREKVDALLVARGAARAAKDWAQADRIRDILSAAGVQVTDVGGQVTWEAGPKFDPAKLEEA